VTPENGLRGGLKILINPSETSSERGHRLVKLCNDRLADAVDLQLQCKHAFWNTTALDLRQLFDQVNKSVGVYADRIAERVVEIGGVANSTERVVPTWSHLLCASDALCRTHALTLATTLGSFAELARRATDTSIEFSDFASADMFAEIADGVDKWHRTLVAV
jgi:starvation-inducible DNA-binding protein